MDNSITTWSQGKMSQVPMHELDPEQYMKDKLEEELTIVRDSPKGNYLCQTYHPEQAAWIAQRLNLASELEELTYKYATGKIDGHEIVKFVHAKLDEG